MGQKTKYMAAYYHEKQLLWVCAHNCNYVLLTQTVRSSTEGNYNYVLKMQVGTCQIIFTIYRWLVIMLMSIMYFWCYKTIRCIIFTTMQYYWQCTHKIQPINTVVWFVSLQCQNDTSSCCSWRWMDSWVRTTVEDCTMGRGRKRRGVSRDMPAGVPPQELSSLGPHPM